MTQVSTTVIKIRSLNTIWERAQLTHDESAFVPCSSYCGQGFVVNQLYLNLTMIYDYDGNSSNLSQEN